MPNPWFRLYTEFASDPKVQMMNEADQRRFVMLLCMKCKEEKLQDDAIVFQLRITSEEWARTKTLFRNQNFIDAENNPIAWDKRQYVSDVSTSRVKKYRKKLKQQRNVSETLPDTDSETDSDSELKIILLPHALGEASTEPIAPSVVKKHRTPIPKTWRPNDAHRQKCRELGFDADKLADEPNGFINYHIARATMFADWDRAFWTWIGNAQKFSRNKPGRGSNQQTNPSIIEAGLRVAARYQKPS